MDYPDHGFTAVPITIITDNLFPLASLPSISSNGAVNPSTIHGKHEVVRFKRLPACLRYIDRVRAVTVNRKCRLRRGVTQLIAESENERPDNGRQDDGNRDHEDDADDGTHCPVVRVGLVAWFHSLNPAATAERGRGRPGVVD